MSRILHEDATDVVAANRSIGTVTVPAEHRHRDRARSRVHFIDVTRGLLILLMSSSHCLGQAHVPPSSFFASPWWLPQGWSTAGFIALSGFTAALLLGAPDAPRRTTRRRLMRACQLLAIMITSNLVFRAARLALGLYDAEDLNWRHLLLPSGGSYSISGVLLPTAILLVLSAVIVKTGASSRPVILAAALAAPVMVVSLAKYLDPSSPITAIVTAHIGDFAVIPLVACGLLGLSLGLLWQQQLSQRTIIAGTLVLMLVPALELLPGSAMAFLMYDALIGVSHLIALLGFALLLLSVPGVKPVARTLSIMGQYGLQCFLGLRIVLGLGVASNIRGRFGPETVYGIYLVAVLTVLLSACTLRSAWPALDRSLSRLYL